MRLFLRPLFAAWRWFRTWPQLRWTWPRPANLVERDRLGLTDAAAHLLPRRLLGDVNELEIVNDGMGAARDVVALVTIVRPGWSVVRAGDSPVIGANGRYIIDLADTARTSAELPDGVWVRLTWRNQDESVAESWAGHDRERDAFIESASPLD